MQGDTSERTIPADPFIDYRLPYGADWVGVTSYEICPDCEEGVEFTKSYLDRANSAGNRYLVTLAKPCPCKAQAAEQYQQEAIINQERTRRANLIADTERLFGGYNMLADMAYKQMTIREYKPANDSQREALEAIKNFESGGRSICLYGPAGRGKTHLALAAAKLAQEQGAACLAIKAIDMLTRIKRTYGQNDDTAELEVMRLLKDLDLLVIDDIGIEKSSEWVRAKFYEVIDYRYRRRSTIYTTNLSGQAMKEKEGQALVSRIWGADIRLELQGNDYRVNGGHS